MDLHRENATARPTLALGPEPVATPRNGPVINPSVIKDLNAQSFAESLVVDATGRYVEDFSPDDWDAVDAIKDEYTPSLCGEPADDRYRGLFTGLALRSGGDAIRGHFDQYVHQPDPLLIRLEGAMQSIIDRVVSSNQWSSLLTWHVPYLGPTLGALRTRAALSRLDLSSMKTGDDTELTGVIGRTELEASASITFKPTSDENAYGNCNEKGLLGAYLASRFPEFKQVAFVAMLTDLYNMTPVTEPVPHAFALACTGDESIYDIGNLYLEGPTNPDYPLLPPQEFFDADCYLIDPWGQIVRRLTIEEILAQRWLGVEHVIKVDLSTPADAPNLRSALIAPGRAVSTSTAPRRLLDTDVCPNNPDSEWAVCGSCPNDADLATTVCAPFDIPSTYFRSNDSVVTVVASDASADEDGDPATFRLSRTGNAFAELTVGYALTGTATTGLDYNLSPSTATFPSGSSTLSLLVTPIEDTGQEGDETATLTLTNSADYFVGSPDSADVIISEPPAHLCADPSVPYTHRETRCATFWGCDGSVRFLKDNVVCWVNGYETITAGSLDWHACSEPEYENCSFVGSTTIEDRVDHDDGRYTIYWYSGSTWTWMNVTPLD